MNNLLKMVYLDFPILPRNFISARLRKLDNDKTLESIVLLDNLSERYQIAANLLWECSLAIKIEPQQLNGHIYLTAQNYQELEQFIKRVEISWACPNILATCCREDRKS